MDHVNNAVYADWLDERVGEADRDRALALVRTVPRSVRLEYARAAGPGMQVRSAAWPDADMTGWSCRFTDPEGADLLRARLEPGPSPAGFDHLG